jgi:membrane protein
VIRALGRAFGRFASNQGFFLAAGLSFYFLICLIPLLFLAASVIGLIFDHKAAGAAVVTQFAQNFPVYRSELIRALTRIMAARPLWGLLGTVILVLFSTQLFSAIRLVLARVFGSPAGTGFVRGLLFDTVVVGAIGPLSVASVVATDFFLWAAGFATTAGYVSRWLIGYGSVAFGLALSTVMFYLTYRVLPPRWVSRRAALAGAVLTSMLWEIAKQLFRLYIWEFDVYGQIYGPLGVLVAFMMFVYYTMIVFILGAAYVAALEGRRA